MTIADFFFFFLNEIQKYTAGHGQTVLGWLVFCFDLPLPSFSLRSAVSPGIYWAWNPKCFQIQSPPRNSVYSTTMKVNNPRLFSVSKCHSEPLVQLLTAQQSSIFFCKKNMLGSNPALQSLPVPSNLGVLPFWWVCGIRSTYFTRDRGMTYLSVESPAAWNLEMNTAI